MISILLSAILTLIIIYFATHFLVKFTEILIDYPYLNSMKKRRVWKIIKKINKFHDTLPESKEKTNMFPSLPKWYGSFPWVEPWENHFKYIVAPKQYVNMSMGHMETIITTDKFINDVLEIHKNNSKILLHLQPDHYYHYFFKVYFKYLTQRKRKHKSFLRLLKV